MTKISLRPQKVSDAQRFYDILSNPKFVYFTGNPKSLEDEIARMHISIENFKTGKVYDYTIVDEDGEIIGWVWVKINPFRTFIGEIWFFIDEKYRGQWLAVEAVSLLEQISFNELKLKRIEIVMQVENTASEKVAIKSWYNKEWLMKNACNNRLDTNLHDARLYAKTI